MYKDICLAQLLSFLGNEQGGRRREEQLRGAAPVGANQRIKLECLLHCARRKAGRPRRYRSGRRHLIIKVNFVWISTGINGVDD